MSKAIVWFRKDIRIEDNLALDKALELGLEIIPVYIYSPEEESFHLGKHKVDIGAASKVWLHYALQRIPELIIRKGNSLEELERLIQETKATHLFWNRRYEPFIIKRDQKIKECLSKSMIVESFNSSLLVDPWDLLNKQGTPYKVFTPFYKRVKEIAFTQSSIKHQFKKTEYQSVHIDDLNLLGKASWHRSVVDFWDLKNPNYKPLEAFSINNYEADRNILALDGSSRVSPYLSWGQISPRQIWSKYCKEKNSESYLRQLIWREFSYYLMYHFPHSINEPLNEKFKRFQWDDSSVTLEKWKQGKTGYGLIDAAMNQLWQTGWMHNRARMIVASFLTKDLLLSWQEGAAWFWDTLVDADLANNTMGWQWVTGSGVDAAPYFRIFNPETQATRFDPDSLYQETWLEERSEPIIDHKFARERALEVYRCL